MNAQEAYKLAIENKYSETDLHLQEVFEAIINRSKKGGFSMDCYEKLNHNMKVRLEQLGYTVEDYSSRYETRYTISWEKSKTN